MRLNGLLPWIAGELYNIFAPLASTVWADTIVDATRQIVARVECEWYHIFAPLAFEFTLIDAAQYL
jgi:hypothetical protein